MVSADPTRQGLFSLLAAGLEENGSAVSKGTHRMTLAAFFSLLHRRSHLAYRDGAGMASVLQIVRSKSLFSSW